MGLLLFTTQNGFLISTNSNSSFFKYNVLHVQPVNNHFCSLLPHRRISYIVLCCPSEQMSEINDRSEPTINSSNFDLLFLDP